MMKILVRKEVDENPAPKTFQSNGWNVKDFSKITLVENIKEARSDCYYFGKDENGYFSEGISDSEKWYIPESILNKLYSKDIELYNTIERKQKLEKLLEE